MARARYAARTFRSGARRQTTWTGSAIDNAFTGLPAATVQLDQSFTPSAQPDVGSQATIVRVRGLLTVRTDQFAATEQAFGALGMLVVSDQASAAGVASIPAPYADLDQDQFFLWQPWSVAAMVIGGASIDQGSRQYVLESKALSIAEPVHVV